MSGSGSSAGSSGGSTSNGTDTTTSSGISAPGVGSKTGSSSSFGTNSNGTSMISSSRIRYGSSTSAPIRAPTLDLFGLARPAPARTGPRSARPRLRLRFGLGFLDDVGLEDQLGLGFDDVRQEDLLRFAEDEGGAGGAGRERGGGAGGLADVAGGGELGDELEGERELVGSDEVRRAAVDGEGEAVGLFQAGDRGAELAAGGQLHGDPGVEARDEVAGLGGVDRARFVGDADPRVLVAGGGEGRASRRPAARRRARRSRPVGGPRPARRRRPAPPARRPAAGSRRPAGRPRGSRGRPGRCACPRSRRRPSASPRAPPGTHRRGPRRRG